MPWRCWSSPALPRSASDQPWPVLPWRWWVIAN